jgi:hypothetical protein
MIAQLQMYEEYIKVKESDLVHLLNMVEKLKIDIDNVRKLMLEYPNEVPHNN